MTRPRRILPGSTYLITKKCMLDIFAIRPEPMVNEILLYCLLVAARKTGVLVHGFCFMSDHYHLIVTDAHARLPEFVQHFNTHTSKAINAHFDRVGPIWSNDKYVATQLFDLDTAIDKVVYVLANPVSAGLVATPEDWPGVTSATHAFGEWIHCHRPQVYFGRAFPKEVAGRLKSLAGLFGEPDRAGDIADRIEGRLREFVETIQDHMKTTHRRFLGRQRVLATPRNSTPAKPRERSELRPCIACKDTDRRIEEIITLQEFWRQHDEARRRFARGERDVKFPPGTYVLRVRFRVRCRTARAA